MYFLNDFPVIHLILKVYYRYFSYTANYTSMHSANNEKHKQNQQFIKNVM